MNDESADQLSDAEFENFPTLFLNVEHNQYLSQESTPIEGCFATFEGPLTFKYQDGFSQTFKKNLDDEVADLLNKFKAVFNNPEQASNQLP